MDDRRFRTLLRSALALSLTTPATIAVVSCREDASPSAAAADAAAIVDAAEPDGEAPAPARDASIDGPDEGPRCGATTEPFAFHCGGGVPPFDGGVVDAGPDADAAALHACGEPPSDILSSRCSLLRRFPCDVLPVAVQASDAGPTPIEDACGAQLWSRWINGSVVGQPSIRQTPDFSIAACSTYCPCTNSAGDRLRGCRGVQAYDNQSISEPGLECLYRPADPSTACGCADLHAGIYGVCVEHSVQVACDLVARSPDAGWLGPDDCIACVTPESRDAGIKTPQCRVGRDDGGLPRLDCVGGCIVGRRPSGLADVPAASGAAVGAWLADASRFEAASVPAFQTLHDELCLHDAPRDLVLRAARAKLDEVRHARITAKLARQFGANEGAWAKPPEVHTRGDRSLAEIALENAVEGCVNETYAALLAAWQSEHARDASIRKAMHGIAEDETRHAALAWSVAEWIAPRLDAETCGRVETARSQAFVMLQETVLAESDRESELVEAGILPHRDDALRLLAALDRLSAEVVPPPPSHCPSPAA